MLGFGLSVPFASVHAGGFSPLALFAANEPGAWYDPSDLTTLYQDSAGTTPVTAVEQPVGLLLDKSRGLVLGTELLNGVGTANSPWAYSGSNVITRNGASSGGAQISVLATIGRTYQITFTVADLSGDTFFFRCGSTASNNITANGTYTYRLTATATNSIFAAAPWAGTAGQATITLVSIRELPGNHASQSTTTARPVLSALVNRLTGTDGFSGATITPATGLVVVATGLPDPRGGNTARQIRNTTTTEQHRLFVSTTVAGRTLYSVEVKNVDAGFVQLSCAGAVVPAFGATFDLTAKTFVLVGNTLPTASIEDLPNGFLRLSVLAPPAETATNNVQLYVLEASTSTINPFTQGTEKSVIVAGADLRAANESSLLPAYQRVTTATDYDTAGFPVYLRLDGTDDWLSTAAFATPIPQPTFYCMGTRLLSLPTVDMHFTDGDATNRQYIVKNTANKLQAFSGSAITSSADLTLATSVLSTLFDGASTSVRRDGASFVTGNAGTSTLGRLYIGANYLAAARLHARMYGLIVRGAATNAGDISATERWLASKSGVTL